LGIPAEHAPDPAREQRADDAQHHGEDDADVLLARFDQAREDADHEAHQDDPEPAAAAEYTVHCRLQDVDPESLTGGGGAIAPSFDCGQQQPWSPWRVALSGATAEPGGLPPLLAGWCAASPCAKHARPRLRMCMWRV